MNYLTCTLEHGTYSNNHITQIQFSKLFYSLTRIKISLALIKCEVRHVFSLKKLYQTLIISTARDE